MFAKKFPICGAVSYNTVGVGEGAAPYICVLYRLDKSEICGFFREMTGILNKKLQM